MIITSYFSQSSGELIRELNEENKEFMLETIEIYISQYEPEYFGFGVEVNTFAKSNHDGYTEFVEFYDEVYTAVKDAHPTTKVFTVFQLEQMKGLDGGLFGGENDLEQNTWAMLDDYRFDIAVFTTYPCLIYTDPSEIPADYYTEITEYTSKPIAFSEMGWLRDEIPGWESDVEEQAEFIEFYFSATSELDIKFETWSFLYDPDTSSHSTLWGYSSTERLQALHWTLGPIVRILTGSNEGSLCASTSPGASGEKPLIGTGSRSLSSISPGPTRC